MVIKGLDIGYSDCKDNEGRKYKSAITKEPQVVSNSIEVKIDDQNYFVGTGNSIMDIDRTNHELVKVLFLTNLAITEGNEFNIITGLPIAQYNTQRDKFKETLLKYHNTYVETKLGGKSILINDVEIFPQGAGALYSTNIQNDALIIDIGGRTIDIALFEFVDNQFNLIKSESLYKGMLTLYGSIVNAVNNKFNESFMPSYAYHIITKGLELDGKPQNLEFLNPIYLEYIQPILSEVVLNYPVRSTNVYLCGGGGNLLLDAFKSRIPHTEVLNDSQFANAIGFYNIACKLWKKEPKERCLIWQKK